MSWRRQVAKLKVLLGGREATGDLEDEIRSHLAMEERENLAAGMTPAEAHYAAMRHFGNRTAAQEASRETWRWRWLEQAISDVRYALRQIRTNPAVATVSVLTLALGIGVNTAMFSVVDAAVLRPLPYADPDRLVALFESEEAPGRYPLAGQDYLDWQKQNRTLEATSLYGWARNVSIGGGSEPEPGIVMSTQANFFDVLGARALAGRTFLRGEDAPGKNLVAILSYGYWQKHFGGDRAAIGRNMELDGQSYKVIGVMPKWFHFAWTTDVWTPQDMTPEGVGPRGNHSWSVIARLKAGVTVAQSRADLLGISKAIEKQFPDSNNKIHAIVVPFKEVLTGDTRRALFILFGAVGLVLLIACVNVANLQLARAAVRQREMAVRASIGAGRFRLVRQLLTESLVLSLLGAVLGALAAWWCVRLIGAVETLPIPRVNEVEVNSGVLLFTTALGILAGMLSGVAPALQLSEAKFNSELKSGSRGVVGSTGVGRALRDFLVVGEIALTLTLLIGAGLLMRSFLRLRGADAGIDPRNLLTASLVLPDAKYPDLGARKKFADQLLAKVAAIPGVQRAALSTEIPLQGGSNGYLKVDGATDATFGQQLVGWNFVTPDYFATFGIPLLEGRVLRVDDMERSAVSGEKTVQLYKAAHGGQVDIPADLTLVAVISKATAKTFWRNQDAVGRSFHWNGTKVIVVGVVGDVKEYGIRGDGTEPRMQAYFPYPFAMGWGGWGVLELKTRVDPKSLLEPTRRAVSSVDKGLAVFHAHTMDEVIADNVQDATFQTFLFGAFATLALVLAAIGLYGVMSYLVTQRTREIGIRVALGAQRGNVVASVLKHGALLTGGGAVLGIIAGVAFTRLMAKLLYGVGPGDPATYVSVPILLGLVAMAASYVPALRATRIDPIVALRWE